MAVEAHTREHKALEVHPTLLLKRCYLAMRRSIEEAIRPFGLSASQFDVLQQLLHANPLEHGELQRRLAVASPSLTNVLDVMERDGWIIRSAVPGNFRAKLISLTARAEALRTDERFRRADAELQHRMFGEFSAEEIRGFLLMLDLMTDKLSG